MQIASMMSNDPSRNIDKKIQNADTTFDLMMGVKSRLMNAYQAVAS